MVAYRTFWYSRNSLRTVGKWFFKKPPAASGPLTPHTKGDKTSEINPLFYRWNYANMLALRMRLPQNSTILSLTPLVVQTKRWVVWSELNSGTLPMEKLLPLKCLSVHSELGLASSSSSCSNARDRKGMKNWSTKNGSSQSSINIIENKNFVPWPVRHTAVDNERKKCRVKLI